MEELRPEELEIECPWCGKEGCDGGCIMVGILSRG